MKRTRHVFFDVMMLLCSIGLLILCAPAHAQGPAVTYFFDEMGHGTGTGPGGTLSLPGSLKADPGPGGLAASLTYSGLGNPPSLVAGDLILLYPGGGAVENVIRFNPAGTGGSPAYRPSLVFYSDILNPSDNDLADTGLPAAFYANNVTRTDSRTNLGSSRFGYVYTPTSGQPGFVSGFTVTYNIVTAPEPSAALLALAALPLVGLVPRRKRETPIPRTS